ncbi:hypothetical protein [Streptomyces sp. NPDC000405]|uniref:hypothetical protein n=1 Tax=Streptomyces sp. NPDC000405 TaxID=3161033 RepID=UPI00398D357B
MNRERVMEEAREGARQALRHRDPVPTETLERLWDALHRWDPSPPPDAGPGPIAVEPPSWEPPRPPLPRRRRRGRARHRRRRPHTRRRLLLLVCPAAFGLGLLLSTLR